MLPDFLRRSPRDHPTLTIGERELPVVVRRLERARRMTLRLAPGGEEVRVSIPRWTPTREALDFARSRSDWLARQLETVAGEAVVLADGMALPFRGQPLVLRHAPGLPRRVHRAEGELRLGGPAEAMAGRIRRWLQDEARALVAADLAEYAARAGIAVPPMALSLARRRWGSCSSSGTVRINWRLVMAPDAVRRSVVAHEVAHLVHFDHSPAFHACLAALFEGDLAAANRWLSSEGRTLYRPFG